MDPGAPKIPPLQAEGALCTYVSSNQPEGLLFRILDLAGPHLCRENFPAAYPQPRTDNLKFTWAFCWFTSWNSRPSARNLQCSSIRLNNRVSWTRSWLWPSPAHIQDVGAQVIGPTSASLDSSQSLRWGSLSSPWCAEEECHTRLYSMPIETSQGTCE